MAEAELEGVDDLNLVALRAWNVNRAVIRTHAGSEHFSGSIALSPYLGAESPDILLGEMHLGTVMATMTIRPHHLEAIFESGAFPEMLTARSRELLARVLQPTPESQ